MQIEAEADYKPGLIKLTFCSFTASASSLIALQVPISRDKHFHLKSPPSCIVIEYRGKVTKPRLTKYTVLMSMRLCTKCHTLELVSAINKGAHFSRLAISGCQALLLLRVLSVVIAGTSFPLLISI